MAVQNYMPRQNTYNRGPWERGNSYLNDYESLFNMISRYQMMYMQQAHNDRMLALDQERTVSEVSHRKEVTKEVKMRNKFYAQTRQLAYRDMELKNKLTESTVNMQLSQGNLTDSITKMNNQKAAREMYDFTRQVGLDVLDSNNKAIANYEKRSAKNIAGGHTTRREVIQGGMNKELWLENEQNPQAPPDFNADNAKKADWYYKPFNEMAKRFNDKQKQSGRHKFMDTVADRVSDILLKEGAGQRYESSEAKGKLVMRAIEEIAKEYKIDLTRMKGDKRLTASGLVDSGLAQGAYRMATGNTNAKIAQSEAGQLLKDNAYIIKKADELTMVIMKDSEKGGQMTATQWMQHVYDIYVEAAGEPGAPQSWKDAVARMSLRKFGGMSKELNRDNIWRILDEMPEVPGAPAFGASVVAPTQPGMGLQPGAQQQQFPALSQTMAASGVINPDHAPTALDQMGAPSAALGPSIAAPMSSMQFLAPAIRSLMEAEAPPIIGGPVGMQSALSISNWLAAKYGPQIGGAVKKAGEGLTY